MSKITQAKKEGKLKGKQAKIAKSAAKKENLESEDTEPKTSGKCINYGKCCTCAHYPKHRHGEAQRCKVSKKYVARKEEHSECYKCK